MEPPRILLVEEDDDLAQDLEANLVLEGYRVETERNGPAGLERALAESWDLVIVDLTLPKMGSLEFLRSLRKADRGVPVLVLTQEGMETERILALRMGADDCLTRPLATLELLARVEALLRRWRWTPGPGSASAQPVRAGALSPSGVDDGGAHLSTTDGAGHEIQGNGATALRDGSPADRRLLRFNQIQVDPGARQVFRNGEPVSLTPREYDLLLALIEGNGDVVSRSELVEQVWHGAVSTESRTVDTHMAELRRKLEEDTAQPRHLLTVRKRGYRFQP